MFVRGERGEDRREWRGGLHLVHTRSRYTNKLEKYGEIRLINRQAEQSNKGGRGWELEREYNLYQEKFKYLLSLENLASWNLIRNMGIYAFKSTYRTWEKIQEKKIAVFQCKILQTGISLENSVFVTNAFLCSKEAKSSSVQSNAIFMHKMLIQIFMTD